MQHPQWLDRTASPFSPHSFDLAMGRMHYVDEGEGSPIVMVHGTPTWSFLYRHLITELAQNHRCIVPDHIGFGLSDKPTGWTYRPSDHARNLRALIEHLGLKDITLVVHDFGGPIGLSYAIEQPDNVKALVVCNTWMWGTQGNPAAERASKIAGSPIGKFLYTRLNFSPRFLVKALWGDKTKLTPTIHQHYTRVFPKPWDRQSTWVLARKLLGSSAWYEQLWQQRDRIKDKPTLLAWGMRDAAFSPDDLARWQALFSDARTITFPDAGHFVPDERGPQLAPAIGEFLEHVNEHAPVEMAH